MEVKGQLISAPGEDQYQQHRKQKERMAELQERRRSLQALLSARLAELRRICLQEAELTGAVPSDFPLEAGEKPPCVRSRGGTSRHANGKCREEDPQRSKTKKTLFSGALRKHSDSEPNTYAQTHKRTVHRGCNTGNTHTHTWLHRMGSHCFRKRHSSYDAVSHCRPPLVSAGSPIEVFYQKKTRRSSVTQTHTHTHTHSHTDTHMYTHTQTHTVCVTAVNATSSEYELVHDYIVCFLADCSLFLLLFQDRPSRGSSDPQSGSRGTNASGVFRSSETLTDRRTKANTGLSEGGGTGRGRGGGGGGGRGGGYSEVLLDYVWGKQQQQLQRQHSQTNNRQPITSHHQLLYNGYASQQPPGAPPTCRGHTGDQRRIKVTRTKSCGPFLPVQQSQADSHNPLRTAIQPDPPPHLLPPRPPQLPPSQDAQLEEATRSLHKALALEGEQPTLSVPPQQQKRWQCLRSLQQDLRGSSERHLQERATCSLRLVAPLIIRLPCSVTQFSIVHF
uniref:Cytohesin Ubiquitin Protein Inducing domain-containing protein n=1 Tax=Mola mola TaxID=94237 RepID=A0A3Q3WDW1_MOLML